MIQKSKIKSKIIVYINPSESMKLSDFQNENKAKAGVVQTSAFCIKNLLALR